MQEPPKPRHEEARLETLRGLRVLDTAPEERFDRFTRLARRLFGVPIALVSLIDADRQWFKSKQGLEASETPREISFCGHAILGSEIFVVPDASRDERFVDNPLVTGEPEIRFYAGYPLAACDGNRIGTLCLIDRQPRQLEEEDLALLRDLGRMVEDEFVALELATVDELTGLSNRRGFRAVAQKALDLCTRTGKPATLLFFDLDRFKPINDRFGHEEGDRALKEIADLLLASFRDSDVIARLGGDEFCVLLSGASEKSVERPVRRLEAAIAARNAAPGQRYALAYSVGTVFFDPARHTSIEDLLRDADTRMYEQKQGRARGER